MNKTTTETLTISKPDIYEFNGVTIRKAVFANGDFTDLKAFHADEDAPSRAFLRSLKVGDELTAVGINRIRPNGFREFVYYGSVGAPTADEALKGF